jgi:hypothetical protein
MKVMNRLARVSGRRIALLKSQNWCKKALLAAIAVSLGFIVGTKITDTEVFAQSNDKNISLIKSFIKPQIKITEAHIGGRPQKFNEEFKDDSDWLQRTAIKLENVSGKPIVFLQILVWFPETDQTGSMMAYPVTLGQRRGLKRIPISNRFVFMPAETLNLSIGSHFGAMSRYLAERQSIESLNRVRLEVNSIEFEDGIIWSAGTFYRPDPKNPSRYIEVEMTSL